MARTADTRQVTVRIDKSTDDALRRYAEVLGYGSAQVYRLLLRASVPALEWLCEHQVAPVGLGAAFVALRAEQDARYDSGPGPVEERVREEFAAPEPHVERSQKVGV